MCVLKEEIRYNVIGFGNIIVIFLKSCVVLIVAVPHVFWQFTARSFDLILPSLRLLAVTLCVILNHSKIRTYQ